MSIHQSQLRKSQLAMEKKFGTQQKASNYDEPIDITIARAYLGKQLSSKDRGISFELSFLEFKSLVSSRKCFFTGLDLHEKTFSIDRIDSSKGYTAANSVAFHTTFNSLKGVIENPNNPLTIELVISGLMAAQRIIDPDSVEKFERRVTTKRGKLSEDDVIAIRQSKEKLKDLSARYGVSIATVSQIRTRLIYKNI